MRDMRGRFSRSRPGGVKAPAASVRFVIKRSFRFGLVVGLLVGLALALVKAFSGRDEEPPAAPDSPGGASARRAPWPRLDADPAVPARPQERLVADPDAPAPEPSRVSSPAAMAPAPAATQPPEMPVTGTESAEPDRRLAEKAAGSAAKARSSGKAGQKAGSAKATKKAAKRPTKKKAAPPRAWVEPDGDVCPTSHPVKGKLTSKIFHVPGGLSYGRTRPDRCYRDEAAAEADGLRPAKR